MNSKPCSPTNLINTTRSVIVKGIGGGVTRIPTDNGLDLKDTPDNLLCWCQVPAVQLIIWKGHAQNSKQVLVLMRHCSDRLQNRFHSQQHSQGILGSLWGHDAANLRRTHWSSFPGRQPRSWDVFQKKGECTPRDANHQHRLLVDQDASAPSSYRHPWQIPELEFHRPSDSAYHQVPTTHCEHRPPSHSRNDFPKFGRIHISNPPVPIRRRCGLHTGPICAATNQC